MRNEIIKFVNGSLQLDVKVSPDKDTVWLNRNQIAQLFDRDVKTIGKHINNALKEELANEVVVAKFATTTQHGAIEGKTQTHQVEYYNLDMIISIGYRVKSKNGVIFRKWANSILKDYMIKGYAVNQKRLDVLNKTIAIQSKMLASTLDIEEKEILNVIEAYSDALSLLDDYDCGCISKPSGKESVYQLTYEECRELINSMKYSGFSDIFGVEKEVYPSIEEKASNLLYFLVKDHPFIDGCKRIGASIFLEFLNKNKHLIINGKQIISDSALVAITLMIAESRPEEKETMIRLVMNFLKV